MWGDDLVIAVWPGELQDQARNLYGSDRAAALLRFAEETTRWFAEPRPHLAFHTSAPRQRVYLTPTIGLDEYVQQWSGGDLEHVHAYSLAELRDDLWPWLLARGYASPADAHELPRFERSLGRRAVHLRPGVCAWHPWSLTRAEELDDRGTLASEIRDALTDLLTAIGEPPLPT